MTPMKSALKTQPSTEKRSLYRLFSTKSEKLPKPVSNRGTNRTPSLVKAESLKAPSETRSSLVHGTPSLRNEAVDRKESPDLMEKFYRAVQSVKGSADLSSNLSAKLTSDLVANSSYDKTKPQNGHLVDDSISSPPSGSETSSGGLIKSTSQNVVGVDTRVVATKGDTAFSWLSRTASCFSGSTSSMDLKHDSESVSKLERSPTDDILVMLSEQHEHFHNIIKETKSTTRETQRQIGLLRRQLEGVKKCNPQKKKLMAAVDELEEVKSVARKLQSKLRCLQETRDVLRRKVYSEQAAQQALESLDLGEGFNDGDQRQTDFELFAKLSYAGLLKGYFD